MIKIEENQSSFSLIARLLHWLMAGLLITMLFIGLFMAHSDTPYYTLLVNLHRPLGIAILWLACLRLLYRFVKHSPSLPTSYPKWIIIGAHFSHIALYSLMLLLPLIGWAMVSAADYPIVMFQGFILPQIAPHNAHLWAFLRSAHTFLAYGFFALIILHVAAAFFHAFILRDKILHSMISKKND